MCSPGHRVSRPRGTGSVGDSVGEGDDDCACRRGAQLLQRLPSIHMRLDASADGRQGARVAERNKLTRKSKERWQEGRLAASYLPLAYTIGY